VATDDKIISAPIRNDLFDYSYGYDDEADVKFDDSIPERFMNEALTLYRKFNGLWGLCLISGMPGEGKDTISNYIQYILHKAFPTKPCVRDEKPRELFGVYDGLFNYDVLKNDLNNMNATATGVAFANKKAALDKAADEWVQNALDNKGDVKLKGSIMMLTEYWRYCSNRDPFAPMNRLMGGIHREKRHLDTLILGSAQLAHDLDRFTCLPYVDWEIRCHKSVHPGLFHYMMYKCVYDPGKEILIRSPMPIYIMRVDGAEPVDWLGEPIRIIDKDYDGTKDENKILDAVRSGIVTWEELDKTVRLIPKTGLLKDEWLVKNTQALRRTLRGLFLMKPPVVLYGCWFRLFNSKSAPQITRM